MVGLISVHGETKDASAAFLVQTATCYSLRTKTRLDETRSGQSDRCREVCFSEVWGLHFVNRGLPFISIVLAWHLLHLLTLRVLHAYESLAKAERMTSS
jgi:hypothetical protein